MQLERERSAFATLAAFEAESAVVELAEWREQQERELARLADEASGLRREREQLKTELVIAKRWVQLLASELEATDALLSTGRTRAPVA